MLRPNQLSEDTIQVNLPNELVPVLVKISKNKNETDTPTANLQQDKYSSCVVRKR